MNIRPRKQRGVSAIGALVILSAVGLMAVGTGWYKLVRQVPHSFDNPEAAFKYGSVGTEDREGIPYWVWLVLPRMFPEYLPGPGGYKSLGVPWEEGEETPVGFSKKTIGFPRIGINCALCHTATYRTAPETPTRIVPTGPAQRFDSLSYLRFLHACASDPRFTAENILEQIQYNTKLSWLDKLLYRHFIIPQTREGLLAQKQRYAWTYSRPDWGPGRIDPFNPVKFDPRILNIDSTGDSTIGNSDIQAIWKMSERAGHALHWDGLNHSLIEVVLSSAIGDGATRKSIPVNHLKELEDFLRDREPPPYPFPEGIDATLAASGKEVFQRICADCHGPEGKRTGSVIPVEEIGTDRHRLEMWTAEAAQRYNAFAKDYPWAFGGFVKTDGYVAKPLTGIWLRAPYLHNGSVPTLEDMLKPAQARPKVFHRGYDVYETNGTGFIHDGPEARQSGFRYDTSVAGNGNGGHEGEAFGTDLTPEEKEALIEYLKTL